MKKDLTKGNVTKTLLIFAYPMIIGNLLQQLYNIADTFIVGKILGADALAAVGSAYTLMTFFTSIIIGLCMGSGAIFSYYYGKKDNKKMRDRMQTSFIFIGSVTIILNVLILVLMKPILRFMQVPAELMHMMHKYVFIIFCGLIFVFLYNYFSFLLRAVGNSAVPLYFLGGAAILNIILDIFFVMIFQWGVSGAAIATVVSQAVAGVGIASYAWIKETELRFERQRWAISKASAMEVVRFSASASIQQSVMNFGILMIQGLVNSFGIQVMAAFTAAVKIDSFAYMPAQEFGNAFSMFISQNYGAKQKERVKLGTKNAVKISVIFCISVSVLILVLAKYLMMIFVSPSEYQIIQIGVSYLRIEGAFYCGIGILFLLYGFYRGINRPEMSLVLTIISLGTRVLLAYTLAPMRQIGVCGIWWAIPIGWLLADIVGILYMRKRV